MGLTSLEVKKAREKFGFNTIKREKKFQLLKSFLRQFADLMILLLIIAAVFAIINHEFIDGYAIIGIVVINAIIGFFQEFKAERAVEALQKLVSPVAKVIRDGHPQIINATEVVPGDIMLIETGDRIAADGVIIVNNNLYIQESTLTGESSAVAKELYQSDKKAPTELQQVFMGTEVTNGFGTVKVLNIGADTKFGRIAKLTQETIKVASPLQREVKQTGILVTKITIVLAGLLFLIGFFIKKQSFVDTLLFTTSVAVAAVPEGLPTTITIALALGVQRLAKKNAIVKRLASAETLGSTSCIITDKTGTLTRNEMFAEQIITLNNSYNVNGEGYKPAGTITAVNKEISDHHNLELIELTCRYCVSTSLNKKKTYYEVLGDPTEAALIVLSGKLAKYNKKQAKFKVLHTTPFDSERKMMSVSIKKNNLTYLLVKGAPESILSACKGLKSKDIALINEQYQALSSQGLRVLAIAKHQRSDTKETDLEFIGLIAILDPPRKEVKKAILQAKQAGIRVIVATGDNGNTAKSIACTLGIVSDTAKIYTNQDLQKLSPAQLQKILAAKTEIIFARVTPEDKLKLVQAAQANEEIVAVTGDGVNDAPALKQADIGVAMGITGTDVSKESASMVLATDKFNTIINAIAEGRKIYNNLKKIVFYLFSSNIGELVPIFFAIMFSLPTPLTAILILIINVGTDALPAIALSVDNEHGNLLTMPPRPKSSRILEKELLLHVISIGFFIGVIALAAFLSVLYSNGWQWGATISPELETKAITVVFVTLICVQFFNAINASNLFGGSLLKFKIWRKKFFLFAIFVTLPIVWLMTANPYLQKIFQTTELSPKLWLTIIVLSTSILIIEELYKKIIKPNAVQQANTSALSAK